MDRKRVTIVFILMLVCLALLVWINVVTGSVSIPPGDVISVVLGRSSDEMWTNIIMNIRLPRMIAAIVLGGCLALSGYLLQTFFDNPIVGPFVLHLLRSEADRSVHSDLSAVEGTQYRLLRNDRLGFCRSDDGYGFRASDLIQNTQHESPGNMRDNDRIYMFRNHRFRRHICR